VQVDHCTRVRDDELGIPRGYPWRASGRGIQAASPTRGGSVSVRDLDHAASRMVRACNTSSATARLPIATTTSRRIWRSATQVRATDFPAFRKAVWSTRLALFPIRAPR
jgi:hypothetical protein